MASLWLPIPDFQLLYPELRDEVLCTRTIMIRKLSRKLIYKYIVLWNFTSFSGIMVNCPNHLVNSTFWHGGVNECLQDVWPTTSSLTSSRSFSRVLKSGVTKSIVPSTKINHFWDTIIFFRDIHQMANMSKHVTPVSCETLFVIHAAIWMQKPCR